MHTDMKNFIIIDTQSKQILYRFSNESDLSFYLRQFATNLSSYDNPTYPFRWLELHAEYKADWYIRYLFNSPDYNHLAVMWCEL